jgi:hypothetical protein
VLALLAESAADVWRSDRWGWVSLSQLLYDAQTEGLDENAVYLGLLGLLSVAAVETSRAAPHFGQAGVCYRVRRRWMAPGGVYRGPRRPLSLRNRFGTRSRQNEE